MARSINNIVVKAVSIALSVSMALSPMVVYAGEIEDAENNLSVQVELRDEAADSVAVAEENRENTEAQIESFESAVSEFVNVDVNDTASQNPLVEDTSVLVEEEINRIENEAIKEVADTIVNVDMSDVDAALNKATELVNDALIDETVADEIVTTADALISIYDTQSEVALNALEAISIEKPEVIAVSENGSVFVDWEKATDEVKDLYNKYQEALKNKSDAESLLKDATGKQESASVKADDLNKEVAKNSKEKNEAISKSKLDKNTVINNIIDGYVANRSTYKANDAFDESVEDSNDIYKFFVNKCENGIVYGCLTYYDSENKVILRKNFSISADGEVDYEYVPKSEWVKGNPGSTETFGNGGNYIAAYVADNKKATYIPNGAFQGKYVSNLMRENIAINETIDARNNALNELNEINVIVKDAEKKLDEASKKADDALDEYKRVVAMYESVASLESEIRNNEVEKAMLEYVKAEVEVYRKQQVLDQVKEALNSRNTVDTDNDIVEPVAQENIQEVVDSIASSLGVEPVTVEALVVKAIIDTEDNNTVVMNNGNETAVAGVRTNLVNAEAATEETVEEIEDTKAVSEKEAVDVQAEVQDEANKTITIEDNKIALAKVGADADAGAVASIHHIVNWWIVLIIALTCAAWMLFVVAKKNQEEEEAN